MYQEEEEGFLAVDFPNQIPPPGRGLRVRNPQKRTLMEEKERVRLEQELKNMLCFDQGTFGDGTGIDELRGRKTQDATKHFNTVADAFFRTIKPDETLLSSGAPAHNDNDYVFGSGLMTVMGVKSGDVLNEMVLPHANFTIETLSNLLHPDPYDNNEQRQDLIRQIDRLQTGIPLYGRQAQFGKDTITFDTNALHVLGVEKLVIQREYNNYINAYIEVNGNQIFFERNVSSSGPGMITRENIRQAP
jgi:hypothetical protein